MDCSVVIPVFNEERIVAEVYRRVKAAMDGSGVSYELLFVDDGGTDGTAERIGRICAEDGRVKLIRLSRNFGHQVAIRAGADHAAGDCVVFIDGDLQDPPELIPAMLELWRSGHDVVYAQRARRHGERAWKRWTAAAFYRLLHRVSDVAIPVDTGDFRLIDRRVADIIRAMPERHPFLRGMVAWVGFDQVAIPYTREPRLAGETKYTLRKMLGLSLDAMTGFSDAPVRVLMALGLLLTVVGLAALAGAVAHLLPLPLLAMLVALAMVGNGLTLAGLGVVGLYAVRIYDDVRARPPYIVRSTRNVARGAARTPERRRDRRLG